MLISRLIHREVGLLGFGREGAATYAALRRNGHDRTVHVFSDRTVDVPAGIDLHVGEEGLPSLRRLDVLVRSPGFSPRHRLRVAADACGVLQTTSTNVFLAETRAAGLHVIGITGSKGKTTTSTLAQLILRDARVPSILVGNVGVPALELLEMILREKLATVFELSSYQCADLVSGLGPTIGCVLDLFPEHMDWHGDVDAYYEAKARIRATQDPGDVFRYNSRSFESLGRALRLTPSWHQSPSVEAINCEGGIHFADGVFLQHGERLADDSGMGLRGRHNRENAVAAFAVTAPLGARGEHLQSVLRSFAGLPYRLQNEGEHGGIRWVNDSLSTAPEAAAAALEALRSSVSVLIVGGYDRGYDHRPLVDALKRGSVETLVVLPDTGHAIATLVRAAGLDLEIKEVSSLDQAVAAVVASAPAGSTCVFSPGAPSYNAYRSFEERGLHFRELVRQLDSPRPG